MKNKLKEMAKAAAKRILSKGPKQTLESRVRARFMKTPLAKSEPKQDFTPGSLDATVHGDQRWASHEPQVYHGLNPNRSLLPPSAPGVTSQIRFIGGDDTQPKAVIKAPLERQALKIRKTDPDGPETSYMLHPNFRTTHREAAYHLMADKAFDMGKFVPKTTVFRHPGTGQPWSAQEFVPHANILKEPQSQLNRYEGSNDLQKLAIMDSILGHNDRHGANTLVDRHGHIHLIDNAGAFDYAHKFQIPTPKYAKHIQHLPVGEDTHKWLNGIDERKFTDRMIQAGAPPEILGVALKRLAEAKRWSRVLRGHPGASSELAGGLQVIQSHRFGDQKFMDEARKLAYDRIKRGDTSTTIPSSDPNKTQIQRPKWKDTK